MKEDNNKRKLGAILIIAILIIVVAALILLKLNPKKQESSQNETDKIKTNETKNDETKTDDSIEMNKGDEYISSTTPDAWEINNDVLLEQAANEIKGVELTENQKTVYNTLVNKTRYYGFYFKKGVTIDNISDEKMLKYAISNFLVEKNIHNITTDLCYEDESTGKFIENYKENCKKMHEDEEDENTEIFTDVVVISSKTINNYIAKQFNTTRVFSNLGADIPIGEGTETYSLHNDRYFIGYASKSGGGYRVIRKLTKVEEDDNNLYFYDKAVSCISGWGFTSCQNGIDVKDVKENLVFEIDEEDEESRYGKELTRTIKGSGDDEYFEISYNTDYIFKNYNNIYNYKHTFKKLDGKYYWVSSEIVNK